MSEEKRAIDKGAALPAISIDFALFVIGAVWLAGQRVRDFENALTAVLTEIQDVADRQRKYIGINGSLTKQIEDARQREIERCIWLAVKMDDDGVPCT